MQDIGLQQRRFVRQAAYLLTALFLCACVPGVIWAQADNDGPSASAWTAPGAMAVRRISPVAAAQHEPNFLSNLDCNLVDYRVVAGNKMQTGCFTATAFGLIDSDSDTVIFNGSDEGLQLLPYSSHQVLAPWPQALDLVVLDAANTGGSYISLYKNPLASLQGQRNTLLQLSAKQLVAPPDLPLRDPSGRQLVVNPQTLAFSDGGSWLAVETLEGSFVRINLATLDMTAFAPSFGSQGSPALLKSQVGLSDDGRFIAIANNSASSLKVYDLSACDGTPAGLLPQKCSSFDYWNFMKQQIDGLQSIRHLRFVNDGVLSFEAQTSSPASSGIYELAPKDKITSLIDYLGLGDSFTSGEGAFDYLSGTDTANNMCHLSANSYPLLLTRDLYSNGGHAVACSGAVINDVGNTRPDYRGQVKDVADFEQLQRAQSSLLNSIMTNYLPGYVAQQRFVKQYQPAVTTVSVGGDDAGFGDITKKCAVPHISLHISDSTCYSTYEDRLEVMRLIDRTVPRWTSLFRQLLDEAPGTNVYAVGYPEIVADTGDCALNVHLGKSELEFAKEFADYLDSSIHKAASRAGVAYVDVSQALEGHRLCETASYNVAVNGLTAGTDGGVLGVRIFGKESYHPNALGHALIEQSILKQTHNLTLAAPAADVTPGDQGLLTAPKTGRVVNTIVPDAGLTDGLVRPRKSTGLKVSGARDGLKANTAYVIRIDGPGGQTIGTAISNDTGDISTSVTLPESTASGGHTIDVTGENQSGEPVDVTQPIYVPVSDNDADGDSVPDILDTCPGAVNSGQDSDQDGIDDSCDGFIGAQQQPGGPGGTNSTPVTTQTDTSSSQGKGSVVNQAGSSPPATAGPGDIGTGLGTPPLTVVTSFALSDGHTGIKITAGPTAKNAASAARALGSETINPSSAAAKTLGPPANNRLTGIYRPLTGLHAINWLRWGVLLLIAWLLVIFGLYAESLLRRPDQTAHA